MDHQRGQTLNCWQLVLHPLWWFVGECYLMDPDEAPEKVENRPPAASTACGPQQFQFLVSGPLAPKGWEPLV